MMKRILIILALGLLSGFTNAQPTAIDNYKTAVIKHADAEYDSAIIYFTRAIQENVKLPGSAYGPRGICFYETGRYEDAMNDFNKEISQHSDSASVFYCYRGLTKIKLVDYEGAMDDFNTAIKIFPKFSLAYKYRGDLSKITGHLDDACADWKTARDFGNNMAGDLIRQYCNP
jgi:tetratricopeptide (TPR) repeat protein